MTMQDQETREQTIDNLIRSVGDCLQKLAASTDPEVRQPLLKQYRKEFPVLAELTHYKAVETLKQAYTRETLS